MRFLFLASLLSALSNTVFCQNWVPVNIDELRGDRRLTPKVATGFGTDASALQAMLFAAPHERDLAAEDSPTLLTIPLPDGTHATFRIVAYDLSAPADLVRFPGVRTWYGINPDLPGQTIFLDWTARGFHAAIAGGGHPASYIDPLFRDDPGTYQSYYRQEPPAGKADFVCSAEADPDGEAPSAQPVFGDCALREYTLAVTATPEYSNYHGATEASQAALVHSAIVTTINRVNQIYSRDLSLRFQLAAGNDQLYFYGPADNPFTNNAVSTLLNENTPVIDERLGAGTYDLGHVFTQGDNNGVGRLRSGCSEFWPGAGATRLLAPEGDLFDVDYVSHEIGHQLGANHTQNNPCNYSSSSGMEPGSGSTIMSYAGICAPNVQGNADAYFHGRSVQEITQFIEIGEGGSCATVINDNLTTPQLTGAPSHRVPAGTPLRLRASATGNGTLSHNWEQYDAEQGTMPPLADNVLGPLFRSFTPTEDTFRYAPSLLSVMAGFDPVWEETPEVSRQMAFRMTTRNTSAAYGCAAALDVAVDVVDDHGPFTLTDPATANQWSAGQVAQVRWNTAGTDAPAYASPTVDILYTTNNGQSFTTLATGEANDGYAEIIAPQELTESGRILVRSHDNIFYNVSPVPFSIVTDAGTPAFAFTGLSPLNVADCFTLRDTVPYELMIDSYGGAEAPVTLSAVDLPAGVSANFEPAVIRPGGSFRLVLEGLSGLPQGNNSASIVGTSAEYSTSVGISFLKTADAPLAGPQILGPGAQTATTRPTLVAAANGLDSYEFQVATDPDFNELLYSVLQPDTAFSLPDYLAPLSRYYWRVRSRQTNGGCGISEWATEEFVTGPCFVFASTADPVVISDGPPPQVAEMAVDVAATGTVNDLDVSRLNVSHTYIGDLLLALQSPAGTTVELINRACGSDNDLLLNLDDEGTTADTPCPPVAPQLFLRPADDLAAFDGESAAGEWTLRATDVANQDGGLINGFGLVVCLENMTLPVLLSAFTATGRKDDVLLAWTTEAEENNYGFFVERTTAVGADWTELGFVAAGADYRFVDATARRNFDYLYRLRQTDLDGRVSYSDLRAARLGGGGDDLVLFPNPTVGMLRFSRSSGEPTPFTITDLTGRTVLTGTVSGTTGSIDLRSLPASVYLLRTRVRARKIVLR